MTAGNSVPDQVIPILIHLISATTSLHQYTVTRLLESIKTDFTNQPLNQVASWCIGEYADVLIAQGVQAEGQSSLGWSILGHPPYNVVFSTDILVIISTLNRLVLSHLSSKSTKSYAINAIAKLSNQQVSSEGHNLIRQNVAKYGTSMILELQQRSVEFSALFDKVSLQSNITSKHGENGIGISYLACEEDVYECHSTL